MKLIAFTTSILLATSAMAGQLTIEKQAINQKSPDEIASIITDYENMCDSGCAYKVTNLSESIILESSPNLIYTWQFINSFRSNKVYSEVTIAKSPEGTIRITTKIPDQPKLDELKSKYGHPQSSMMDQIESTWTLTPSEGGTNIEYKITVTGNVVDMPIAKGIIKREVNKSAAELLTHFE